MASSSFVRLRGLPFSATEQDVAQWFASAPGGPINVVRVIFTYNNTGRKSGEAVGLIAGLPFSFTNAPAARFTLPCTRAVRQFAELPEFMAERAVQLLHNRNMQNRYIEMFVSSEAEASQAPQM